MGAVGVLLAATALLGASATASAASSDQRPRVVQLKLSGVVDPFVANYIRGGIARAQSDGAAAVLLTIDTPGGLDSSMREINQAILNSKISVICYTAPSGARAASAGTFIMLACPVNAMAPGTEIGAAHPVGVSGAIESQKVLDDAVAYIRSIADARGRNADWAESAVRDSVSIPAEEAVQINVVDLIAPDVPTLLEDLNEKSVPVANGQTVTLDTTGATVSPEKMGVVASLLHGLLSPDLAFIFFYLGIGLIVLEFVHPGIGLAAVFGILCLAAAFVSFGALPVQILGVVLLIGSVISFILELKAPGVGIFTVVGVLLLVAGALTLFDPSVPNAHVSWVVIVLVAGLTAAFFGLAMAALLKARRLPVKMRTRALIGQVGVVTTSLTPTGVVLIASESWSAVSTSGPVPAGTRVVIVDVDGLRLKVSPASTADGRPTVPDGDIPVSERSKQLEHGTAYDRAEPRPT
jgi:membrane-bound serine protease (ClpP class)